MAITQYTEKQWNGKVKTIKLAAPLPKEITALDLKSPRNWRDSVYDKNFELWYSERFGWCIPTLNIRRARGQAHAAGITNDRTYAVTMDGETVRIGYNPKFNSESVRVRIIVRKSRLTALQKFFALRGDGAERANDIRDRISTRRMRRASWW